MKGEYKKLISDIKRDKDLDKNIPLYMDYMEQQYNYYCMVKLSMNYYTLREMYAEKEIVSDAVKKHISDLDDILKSVLIKGEDTTSGMAEALDGIRKDIEQRMQVLTSFTDGYEIYEYILNRVEAGLKGTVKEDVSPEQLSAKVFKYIFSENDAVVVNSKLQLVMSQLPVRMTKNKFYDILTNTITIYKGGDKRSVIDFVDMLKKTALIDRPYGFDSFYPDLYDTYKALNSADYKNISLDEYDRLTHMLEDAARVIEEETTMYILLQEIVNDVYAIVLTNSIKNLNSDIPAYKAASNIISVCISEDDMESIDMKVMDFFAGIEGVQEDIYENVMLLEAASDDIITGKADAIERLEQKERGDRLQKLQKLVSTSLFADLSKQEDISGLADGEFIMELRNSLTNEFAKCFEGNSVIVNRSIMSKLFSVMPVFFNSQQEIKDYLDYVLCGCSDKSELTACDKLLGELIEKE